ncbi:hypothetical protein ACFL5X_00495 [Candidatus Omnitrophota bacterium]
MDYSCPVCGELIPQELSKIVAHGEGHVVDEVKKKHPDWVRSDGLCNKCYVYYKEQIHPHPAEKRQRASLLKNVFKRLKPGKKRP